MDRLAPGDMVLTYGSIIAVYAASAASGRLAYASVLQAPFDTSSLLVLAERTRFGTQEVTLIDRCTVRKLWSSTC